MNIKDHTQTLFAVDFVYCSHDISRLQYTLIVEYASISTAYSGERISWENKRLSKIISKQTLVWTTKKITRAWPDLEIWKCWTRLVGSSDISRDSWQTEDMWCCRIL